jgi:PBP1b-binding outer membrane lipoprotein LpoB
MKSWILSSSLTVSLLILSGCSGSPTPAKKEDVKIDTTLPRVSLTTHGVISGMKSIAFEWKSIKDPRVKGIYVYKQAPE